MAQLLHTSPRDWPMPPQSARTNRRPPTLEEIMRSGAPWPSRSPPPDPLENTPPTFSRARTPVSPYTPQRRAPLVLGDRGFNRAVSEVQNSPKSGAGTARVRTSAGTPGRKSRPPRGTRAPPKPFELNDSGQAALSPRLNRWLKHQAAGDSEDSTVGTGAARKADIEAQRLRQEQRQRAAERDMKSCLVQVLRLIEDTNTTAIKSNATSALLSLALNPKNASAFLGTSAFRVLLDLCSESDPRIRANVLAILSALTESPLTRRALVQQGCARAIVPHTRLKDPELAKFATGTILNLCALEQNRDDLLADQALVPTLLALLAPGKQGSDSPATPRRSSRSPVGRDQSLRGGTDPRLQRDTMSTLSLLVFENTKRKLHILDHGGTVPVLLRVAADEYRPNDVRLLALQSLETLLDTDGAEYPRNVLETMNSASTHRTLSAVLGVEDDIEILASVLRIIRLLTSTVHSFSAHFVRPSVGSLGMLLDHARRLTSFLTAKAQGTLTLREMRSLSPNRQTSPVGASSGPSKPVGGGAKSTIKPSAVLASVVAALLATARSKRALVQIFKLQHCSTVMELCRSKNKKVRRGGGNLLQRLSTLNNSKLLLYASGATPMLLKILAERPDEFVIHTAATTLAELAEEPSVRVAMVQEPRLLESLVSLVFEVGVPAVRFEVARTLADLAEAVDNRLVIALRCGKALVSLLRSKDDDDPRTISHAVRCYANLAQWAGHTSDSSPPATGRHGAIEHTEYGADENSDDEEASRRRQRLQDDDSEECDFSGSDDVDGHEPEEGDRDATKLETAGTLRTEPRPLSEEDSTEEETEEDMDYYWDTGPGAVMARNFNTHCLPRILAQIASSGALGLILSAPKRQQVVYAKRRNTSNALAKLNGMSGDVDAGVDNGDEINEDPVVLKWATHIVRQLTLDVQQLTDTVADSTKGSGPRTQTHRSTCPVCKGLSTTFTLPSERKDFTTSESSQDTTDRLFNFEAVRQRILTEGLETTREYLALQEHEEEKGSDMIQQARNNMTQQARKNDAVKCSECTTTARLSLMSCPDCALLQAKVHVRTRGNAALST